MAQFGVLVFQQLAELTRNLREMKFILYGNSEVEPVPDTCAQLTQAIFQDNMLRLMIQSVPKIDLEVCHVQLLVGLSPSIMLRTLLSS
jgi:hypothetical protein